MTRSQTFITALLVTLFVTGGVAASKTMTNTKWLNTKWLNTDELNASLQSRKWLRSADLNASDGGATFYNPWTGQVLPDVSLVGTTFVSPSGSGDAFAGTWTTAVLGDMDPAQPDLVSYAYIAGRYQPPGADPDSFLYWVYTWSPDIHGAWGWHHACVDADNVARPAIPLSGEWNYANGSRISYGGNKFTWACTSGALGKCAASGEPNMLGYAPWKSRTYYQAAREFWGKNELGQPMYGDWYWPIVDGQYLHQACTRMVRADYCGDGTSGTVDGNEIDVADFLLGGESTQTSWDAEAVWTEDGARWVSYFRSGLRGQGNMTCTDEHCLLTCTNNHYVVGHDTAGDNPDPEYLPTPDDVVAFQQGFHQLPAFTNPGSLILANRNRSWSWSPYSGPTLPWVSP